jgi:hypothetical protein
MDLPKLWALIKTDLERARNTLPMDATHHNAVKEYESFLSDNELELACDMLEMYAENEAASKEFWLALRDAATRMELPERASRYESYAKPLN